jgi:uncharacterized membrane protein YgcG
VADRNKIRDHLLAGFREKKYDATLLETTTLVATTLEKSPPVARKVAPYGVPASNAPAPVPAAAPASGSGMTRIIVICLFAFLGIIIIRAIFSALQGGHAAGGYGGGGGGFFSSMLGGIGGAMLGSYMYDRMTDNSSSTAHASDASDTSSDADTSGSSDYDNSGGSFDSGDSGGGSFE